MKDSSRITKEMEMLYKYMNIVIFILENFLTIKDMEMEK